MTDCEEEQTFLPGFVDNTMSVGDGEVYDGLAVCQALVGLCHAAVPGAAGRCVVAAVWQTLQGQ